MHKTASGKRKRKTVRLLCKWPFRPGVSRGRRGPAAAGERAARLCAWSPPSEPSSAFFFLFLCFGPVAKIGPLPSRAQRSPAPRPQPGPGPEKSSPAWADSGPIRWDSIWTVRLYPTAESENRCYKRLQAVGHPKTLVISVLPLLCSFSRAAAPPGATADAAAAMEATAPVVVRLLPSLLSLFLLWSGCSGLGGGHGSHGAGGPPAEQVRPASLLLLFFFCFPSVSFSPSSILHWSSKAAGRAGRRWRNSTVTGPFAGVHAPLWVNVPPSNGLVSALIDGRKQGNILGLGFYVFDLDLVFWIRKLLFSFFCSRDLDLLTR